MELVRSLTALRRHAEVKLGNLRKRDIEQHGRCDLDLPTLVKMALESSDECECCGCRIIFEDYAPYCRYQWSPDRIDRNRPHSKDNCRIRCLSCNVSGPGVKKGACKGGRHPGDLPLGSSPSPPPDEKEVPFPLVLSPEAKAGLMKALADQMGEWEDGEIVTFRPSEGEFQISDG